MAETPTLPELDVARTGQGGLSAPAAARAAERLTEAGALLLRGAFAPPLVETLCAAFLIGHAEDLREAAFEDTLVVGDRRNMIPVSLAGPFNNPALYANPNVMPILRALLGADFVMGSMTAVTALAGAEMQRLHRDNTVLFGDDALDFTLPPYALTLVLPLVPVDARNGTACYPGTHRRPGDLPVTAVPVVPAMAPGDALLFDCRLWHCGAPNQGRASRPVLYNSYQRPWFRDADNFERDRPMKVTAEEFGRVPEEHRDLFAWALREAG